MSAPTRTHARPLCRLAGLVVALILALTAAAACGPVMIRPGYVYYDSYGYPYTYVAYGGGYRIAYFPPGYIVYRGGAAFVGPGATYYYQRPRGGVFVPPPRGAVQVNAPPPAPGGVRVHGR